MTNPALLAAAVAANAAQAARLQHLDAFRLADATAPQRARPLGEVGVTADAALAHLRATGVVREGAPGTFYLDEAALIAQRPAGLSRRGQFVIVWLAAALGLGLVLLAFLLARRR